MRKIFAFCMLLFSIVVCTCLISCGDDEKSDGGLAFDKDYIVGTWIITTLNGTSPFNDKQVGSIITFNADGTCSNATVENSYKISGGKVYTIYDSNTDEPAYVYTLLAKNGNTITVEIRGTLNERNQSVNVIMVKQ